MLLSATCVRVISRTLIVWLLCQLALSHRSSPAQPNAIAGPMLREMAFASISTAVRIRLRAPRAQTACMVKHAFLQNAVAKMFAPGLVVTEDLELMGVALKTWSVKWKALPLKEYLDHTVLYWKPRSKKSI